MIARFSFPLAVLMALLASVWLESAKTDTRTDTIGRNGAASPLHSTRQALRPPRTAMIARGGQPSRGRRADNLVANWSGYVCTADTCNRGLYTSAQATWTVPKVKYVNYANATAFANTEHSVIWVGIDGYGINPLIQLGTEQDIAKDGTESYNAWYEVLPASQTTLDATRYVVNVNDTITASLQCLSPCTPSKFNTPNTPNPQSCSPAPQTWILSIANGTRWKFSTQLQYCAVLATAEWIVEDNYFGPANMDPDYFAYLPDFGSVKLSGVTANGANPNLVRQQNALMVTDPNGKAWSVPSDPVGGNSFTMTFQQPPAP